MSNQSTNLQNAADKARDVTDKIQREAGQAVDSFRHGAEDRVSQVAGWAKEQIDTAQDRAKEVQDRARMILDTAEDRARELLLDTKQQLKPMDSWLRTTAREHPFMVVGAAVGVGFLIGSLLSVRSAAEES